VRMLLGEVGKLREERRSLQFELGYLMCMKSKYGPGGEFDPDWKPPTTGPGGPPADAPPPAGPPEELPQAKPAWRSVTRRNSRGQKNTEQTELLNNLSENRLADSARQHEATVEAVRSTTQEQVPFNVQGYLDESSKALAPEVRMLLGEVGKLREERRSLQFELGYLMCMKSKYGPGGDFEPDWKPPTGGPGGPPVNPPPPAHQETPKIP